jgi:hypothetical protein
MFKFHAKKYTIQNETNRMTKLSKSITNLRRLKNTQNNFNMDSIIKTALFDANKIISDKKSSTQVKSDLLGLTTAHVNNTKKKSNSSPAKKLHKKITSQPFSTGEKHIVPRHVKNVSDKCFSNDLAIRTSLKQVKIASLNSNKYKKSLEQRFNMEKTTARKIRKREKITILHKCAHCPKEFTYLANLCYHMRMHENKGFLSNFLNMDIITN